MTAVHVQQETNTLLFAFDSSIVSIDAVVAEQFECTLDGEAVVGNSIDSFDAAGVIINFGMDVSAATAGTLISGAGIIFGNGGVAGDGQTQPVTLPT